MSQIRRNTPLFYLGQDHITFEEQLALGTGSAITELQRKTPQ
jgi:hypothetical protein